MLTSKQEAFCKNIVLGLTKQNAYLQAYNTDNKTVASVEATKLLKREDITSYIKTLKKPITNHFENECINARQQQLNAIDERIEECIKNADETNLRQYIDMKNKLLGLYKDTDNGQSSNNTLDNLDTSTLKALITTA